MTLDEAIEEIREHGWLVDFRPQKGAEALRVIDKALKDYKQLKEDYIDLDRQLREANTRNDDRCRDWIPCSERLPEDDERVLGNITITVNTNMTKPKQRTIFAKHDRVLGWTTANGYPIVGKITHWLPLPDDPPGGEPNA